MATLRTVLNRAFNVLGEDQIPDAATELTNSAHRKVLEFLNQFKEEIEDAHNWRSLRVSLPVTVEANLGSAAIAGANERSRLSRESQQENGQLAPLVYDVTDAVNPAPLTEIPLARLQRLVMSDPSRPSGGATSFSLGATGTTPVLYTWPVVSEDRDYEVTMIVPQDALSVLDLDTTIKIPTRPLLQATIWYALVERGEELGQSSMFTEERFRKALDDAISLDNGEQGELEMVVV